VTLYVDSSALLKRYVDEPDSTAASELIDSDPSLVTSRITLVEVRRNLARLLDPEQATAAKATFLGDIRAFSLVELDHVTCEGAATIAELLRVRTLDAIHLASAQRLGGPAMPFLTFDLRQAQAARTLGFAVLGT
jgi:predicted nucleic acid-binding protein